MADQGEMSDFHQVVDEGGIFRNLTGNWKAGMHKGHAAGSQPACSAFDPVVFVGLETLTLYVLLRAVHSQVDGDDSDQGLAFVFGDALPRDQVDLFEGIGQPVIIAEEVISFSVWSRPAHIRRYRTWRWRLWSRRGPWGWLPKHGRP